MGDCINCKSLDNRIAVFILIETLKIRKPDFDTYAVFTVQEEVGIRGAQLLHKIKPVLVGLVYYCYDVPKSNMRRSLL